MHLFSNKTKTEKVSQPNPVVALTVLLIQKYIVSRLHYSDSIHVTNKCFLVFSKVEDVRYTIIFTKLSNEFCVSRAARYTIILLRVARL